MDNITFTALIIVGALFLIWRYVRHHIKKEGERIYKEFPDD